MRVPFLDLKAQHDPLKAEIMAAISEVIDASAFAGGPHVAAFEKDFAAYCQTRHSVAVGNGTDALWFVLLALGVGPGDEVVTVPTTFMATAEAISFCGAKPVFVDIDPRTYLMDPAKLEAAITPRTKAIIPVHLFGQVADMDPILEIARRKGLPVVEDACQAHGAEYKGRRAGSLGVAGCFSFYPGKNLGAMGEGGAVTTNDDELKRKIEVLREHGQTKKYHHDVIGWNGRMDGIQGAILRIKLRGLDRGNEARRSVAARYDERVGKLPGVTIPHRASYGTPVYHIYAIAVDNRDELLKQLNEGGVACGIHYPVPVHQTAAYRHLGLGEGSFPVAERSARRFLSLPMFPELSAPQVDFVCDALSKILQKSS